MENISEICVPFLSYQLSPVAPRGKVSCVFWGVFSQETRRKSTLFNTTPVLTMDEITLIIPFQQAQQQTRIDLKPPHSAANLSNQDIM